MNNGELIRMGLRAPLQRMKYVSCSGHRKGGMYAAALCSCSYWSTTGRQAHALQLQTEQRFVLALTEALNTSLAHRPLNYSVKGNSGVFKVGRSQAATSSHPHPPLL